MRRAHYGSFQLGRVIGSSRAKYTKSALHRTAVPRPLCSGQVSFTRSITKEYGKIRKLLSLHGPDVNMSTSADRTAFATGVGSSVAHVCAVVCVPHVSSAALHESSLSISLAQLDLSRFVLSNRRSPSLSCGLLRLLRACACCLWLGIERYW